jgi:hypothetical protein
VIRIFTGFDQREAAGWHVFAQSLIERTSQPFSITPLQDVEPRDGSNAFTYSRFMVPYLCDFSGFAIFVDGPDMAMLGDIAELWEQRSGYHAAQVVKHEYKTKFPRKYVGSIMETRNEDYPRKNWSSVIVWNCGHYANRILTPECIKSASGEFLHRFGWVPDEKLGDLDPKWNWLADEYGQNTKAKLLHWTAGIPAIRSCVRSPHAQHWFATSAHMKEIPLERIEKSVTA